MHREMRPPRGAEPRSELPLGAADGNPCARATTPRLPMGCTPSSGSMWRSGRRLLAHHPARLDAPREGVMRRRGEEWRSTRPGAAPGPTGGGASDRDQVRRQRRGLAHLKVGWCATAGRVGASLPCLVRQGARGVAHDLTVPCAGCVGGWRMIPWGADVHSPGWCVRTVRACATPVGAFASHAAVAHGPQPHRNDSATPTRIHAADSRVHISPLGWASYCEHPIHPSR